ncbi:MAG TPA: hypothetical protein IGS37_16200 [Synechococcales cyanobacterium M55_K2018_004]|nr:hypothetical protein [Synechococcales cyanobacterium M55_K2018_004]
MIESPVDQGDGSRLPAVASLAGVPYADGVRSPSDLGLPPAQTSPDADGGASHLPLSSSSVLWCKS